MNIKKLIGALFAYFYKLYDFVAFAVYPPYCVQCRKFLGKRSVFCDDCMLSIQPIVTVPLHVTKKWIVPVIAVSAYKEPLKRLILAKGRSDYVAAYHLGQLIWERTSICNATIDYIVPIPLYWRRYARRGYNQAEQIAQFLAKKSGGLVSKKLKRMKNTKFQSQCNGKERASNVRDSFSLFVKGKNQFKNKHILLVDDLMTTGSTLSSAVRELIKSNPASITAVVACRVTQS